MSIRSLTRAKNLFPMIEYSPKGKNLAAIVSAGGSTNKNRNLGNRRIPIQLPRIKQDITSWREWIQEAENAYWPFRVKMQQGYMDTVLNAHVAACMNRRKNLTLLREYEFRNSDGTRNEEWTKYFQRRWFKHNFVNYVLDAKFYGYNLISLGDIGSPKKNPSIMDCYPLNPTIITRWHISPDREEVANFIYSPSGTSFEKGIPDDYHVFVTTISDTGINNCGYGLLYPAAYLEILLRANTGFNTDFIQMFAQPLRVLYTDAMEGAEQDNREAALRNMGASAYMMLNSMGEKLEFISDSSKGNGYKSYNDFDHRLKGDIAKLFLGHEDAISSVPGKMGSSNIGGPTNDDAAASPVQAALRDIQTEDGQFCEPIYNDMLLPKLRNLGIPVPNGGYICYLNDAEKRAVASEEAKKNQQWATLALTMAQGGLKMDADFFTKTTGVPCESIEVFPDKNVIKDEKEIAAGKQPLKQRTMQREQKPKKTNTSAKNGYQR